LNETCVMISRELFGWWWWWWWWWRRPFFPHSVSLFSLSIFSVIKKVVWSHEKRLARPTQTNPEKTEKRAKDNHRKKRQVPWINTISSPLYIWCGSIHEIYNSGDSAGNEKLSAALTWREKVSGLMMMMMVVTAPAWWWYGCLFIYNI
jgi:hypothetical protein